MEIQAATGEWMNEYVRRPSRRRDNRVYVPPADVVKRSIRRSWTISNPSSRWSATRGSPELRAYNSLPRHQECCYSSLNHSPRDKSPSYPTRDESGPCGSPRSRDTPQQPSSAHKYSLPDDQQPTERPSTSSPPPPDVDKRPTATTTSEPAEQGSPPAGAFRMSTSPALSARVRRQQYFSSRSDDDTEFQSRYLQNHVLRQHRQKSEDYVAPEDKSSSPGSSPSVQESRLAAARDLRDVTSSSTSHSSREVSPLARRHQSFDVTDRPQSRTISLLQSRHSSVEAAPPPASPHRRYLVLGQDVPSSRHHSLLDRQVLSSSAHRRPLLHRDYVSSTLEYSGNSDSGGEVVATPPPLHGRRYGRDDASSLSSHKADGSPVHASSGDDFDVEPISGTVFRKVTVKKRRQETRRVLDNGRFSRRSSSRVVESVRVTEVSSDYYHPHHHHRPHHHDHHHHHHHHRHEPLLLAPDVDDYKLVFISSDSSSSKEDDEDEDEDEGADEDTESSSSAGCDWDYFEQGCCGERAVEEVTLCDQHCPAPPEPASAGAGGGGPSGAAASAAAAWRGPASPWCAACGSATVLPVPVPIPVPVPFPVPFWSPAAAHQQPFMQDAAIGVTGADVVAAASGGGGVRIRIRNPPTSGTSRVMVGPWSCSWPAELISPLISGSTVVAVTSTGAVVQCPSAVDASSSRALAAVPACEIFIRHERAEEPPATVAEIAAPADLPRRDTVPLSEADSADKAVSGADSTDDARESVTVEPVDKAVIPSESVVQAAVEQDNNKDSVAEQPPATDADPEPSGEPSAAQEKSASSTDPAEPSSQDSVAQEGSDPAQYRPDTSTPTAPATNTVRFDLSERDDEPDEPATDDTLERQRRALLSLPRERLHSSSSTSSSTSSTSSEGCQDSEDEGAVTSQVAAGCYTVTAGGDSDEDSDASEATSTSSGGEFSKVFVVNSGADDESDESDEGERDGLPEAPAETSSGESDAEDGEGGAVVLLKHASFNSDDKTEEASERESSLQQNQEETVVCSGKKSNAPAVLSELACAADEDNTEKCEDGIVLLKHVKTLEAETATVDASLHKGEEEKQESGGDGIVLVKHVKKLEEDSADVPERVSDSNSDPDGVPSAKDTKEEQEEGVEDGNESEDSASDEMQMHHDTGDSSDSDSDSDSSTFSTSGCDSDLDSGDGGVVLLRHVEVLPEADQKVVNEEQLASVARDDVDKECGDVVPESVSDADSRPVVEGVAEGETENSDDDTGDEGAEVEEAESDSEVEGECTVVEVKEETGGENNDRVLDGKVSGQVDDLPVSEGAGSDSVLAQEANVAEQGAVVVTPVEEEVPAASAVSSSSGEGPQQPEVTTETRDEQKPAGHGEDGGESTATQEDELPVECKVLEEEESDDVREEEEVVECVEEMAESIVKETVATDEVHSVDTVEELEATGSDAEESAALREGIREPDEDKAATTGGGEAPRDSWSGGVVLRRIRHLDDEGSDPALGGGRARNYDGRAAASSSPPGSEMAPAAAAERGARDTEEGVRNTCISLAALFAECDSANPAVREDEVSVEDSAEVAVEVDQRVVTTGAGTSGPSAEAEAPVDVGGESAAEMTSGDSAPAEHALDRERGREDVMRKTAVKESNGEESVTGGKVEEHSGEVASANLEPPEIEQPVEPDDAAAHLLSDVSRRSRSASESEGTVKLEEEETESAEEESAEEELRGEGARAAAVGAPGAPSTAAPASVGRESPTRADAGQHGCAPPPERYTSLVMITQDAPQQSVSVVTSETTTLVPAGAAAPAAGGGSSDVVVRHTNWEEQAAASGLAGYFTLTLEAGARSASPSARRPLVTKMLTESAPEDDGPPRQQEDVHVVTGGDTLSAVVCLEEGLADDDSWVEEVGDRDEDEFATSTASEGEDDSSCDESGAMRTASYSDREEELRGYHRSAIDFTLHTIVEESCEESEVEHASRNGAGSGRKSRPTSASELEKYFFFRLGNGAPINPSGAAGARELDSMSDTCSSIYSEGLESLGGGEDGAGGAGSPRDDADADELAALASSRLEKYFLTGFMGFMGPSGEGAGDSDGSGSVGSDSEGRPSPEQRRKRLVTRARRGHQLSIQQMASPSQQQQQHDVTPELSCSEAPPFSATEDSSSTETEGLSGSLGAHDETITTFDRPDGQFDTVKRKKKRRSSGCPSPAVEEPPSISTPPSASLDAATPTTITGARESSEDEDGAKTPQPEFLLLPSDLSASRNKQHSRDSGFIGSCDDLLKEQRTSSDSSSAGGSDAPTQPPSAETVSTETAAQKEEPSSLKATPSVDDSAQKGRADAAATPASSEEKAAQPVPPPPATSLTRKDSFNNWSSDEETNLMMSKMRAFFKTMVAAAGANSSGRVSGATSTSTPQASPGVRPRSKPPQLVYFENELTRLMKTVPGIRDDQVREIVEYLSSEDTWSDSYDSSDYTSSDLEAQHEHHHRFHQYHPYASYQPAAPPGSPSTRSDIQEQISASCRQIINKFDTAAGGPGDDGLSAAPERDRGAPSGADDKDNALVYQKLVASFSKMASNEAAAAPAAAGFGGPVGAGGGVAGGLGGGVGSASSTPHSSPPLFAKVMQHIGSRLVALMHEVSGGEGVATSSPKPRLHHHGHHHHHHHHHHHRRLQQKPSSASTTTEEEEEEDSSHTDTEQSPAAPLLQLPRSKSHDLLLEQQQHEARLRSASSGGHVSDVERSEHSDYERFSWRGSFESALMAADSRTKLSLLAGAGSGSGGMGSAGGVCGALPESCKRRSAGDLLLASSREREQAAAAVDRVRSCGSIGGLEQEQVGWRRRSSVPDAGRSDNTSADDEDDDDDDDDVGPDEGGEERARSTTLPRSLAPPGGGAAPATSNSLPRLPPSLAGMHKAHSVHHLLQAAASAGHVKSARYRPPGFVSRPASASATAGPPPKRAVSAPGLHQPQPAPRANAPARRRPQPPTSLLPSGEDLAAGEEAASTSASLQRPLSKSATPSPVVGGAASRKNSTSLSVAGDFAAAAADADDSNKLRPGLSPLGARSDSLASVYSGAGEGRYGTVAVRGEVEFGLQYNYKAGALEILVKQCRDLAPVDTKRNRSDPYVKVYLLPDKSKSGKRKTKVKKHTLNPSFDETLKFHITLHGLETRTLWLTVWHSDMFGRNDFLGEVMMSLENKVFDDPTPQWYPLQERTEPFDDLLSYKGDIIIGLKFVPPDVTVQKKGKRSRGSLQVLVKEAKNLTAVKANGTSDPFCKSYLLPDKGRSSKQKTPVLRRTCNPVWNYTFAYEDVSLQELSERSLELTVWDHDRLASNEFLGGLRFNLGTGKHYGKSVDWMDATGKEMTLWQSMLERPNFWVEGCLTLRPSLEHRSTNS